MFGIAVEYWCPLDAEFDALEVLGQLVDKLLFDRAIRRYSHSRRGPLDRGALLSLQAERLQPRVPRLTN